MAPGHPGVVDRDGRLAQDPLDGQDPFGESDVGQLRGVDHVAGGPDPVGRGPHVLVDHHEAPFVDHHSGPLGTRPAVNGRRPTETIDGVDRDLSRPRRSSPSSRSRSGVCPVTFTPVWTAIPRFRNDRATTADHVARRIRSAETGSASRTVTWLPRSENMEANSQPMAPPPMMATDAGGVSSDEDLVGGEDQPPVDAEAGDRPRHRPGGQHDVAGPSARSVWSAPVTRTRRSRRGARPSR